MTNKVTDTSKPFKVGEAEDQQTILGGSVTTTNPFSLASTSTDSFQILASVDDLSPIGNVTAGGFAELRLFVTDFVIVTDLTSINEGEGVAEYINLSDTTTLVVGKGFTEAAYSTDQISIGLGKLFEDAATVSDTTTLAVQPLYKETVDTFETLQFDVTKQITDTSVAVDLAALTFGLGTQTDFVVQNDSDRWTLTKVKSETLISSDDFQGWVLDKQVNDSATALDYLGIADGSTFSLVKRSQDSATPSDTSTWNLGKSLDDTAVLSDQSIFVIGKSLSDSQVLLDTLSFDLGKSLDDTTASIDSASWALGKTTQDTQSVSDTHSWALTKSISDLVTVLDSTSTAGTGLTTYNETQNTVDNLAFTLGTLYQDSYSVSDSSAWTLGKAPSDSVSVSEATQFAITKQISDIVTAVDDKNIITNDNFNTSRTDSSAALDNLAMDLSKNLGNETAVVTDLATLTLGLGTKEETITTSDDLSWDFAKVLDDPQAVIDAQQWVLGKIEQETLTTSDSYALNFTKVFSDSASALDLVGIADGSTFTLNKLNSDSVLAAEQTALIVTKTLSDFVTVTDQPYFTGDTGADDTATLTDSLAFDFAKAPIDDSLTVQDSPSWSINKPFDDGLTASDTNAWTLFKTFDDSVTSVDLIGVGDGITFSLIKAPFEVITETDDLIYSLGKGLSDLQPATDAKPILDVSKVLDDSYSVPDSSSFTLHKLFEDTATALDLVAVADGSTFDLDKVVNETITQSETVRFDVTKLLQDSVAATDNLNSTLGQGTKADNTAATDSSDWLLGKLVQETIDVSEETVNWTLSKAINDVALFVDSASLTVGLGTFTDTVTSNSDDSWLLNKPLTETLVSSDNVQQFTITKLLQDSASAIDLVGVADGSTFTLQSRYSDTALVNELAALTVTKSFSDTITVVDAISRGTSNDDNAVISDSGLGIMQSYVDNNQYFAEDYVGESFTF